MQGEADVRKEGHRGNQGAPTGVVAKDPELLQSLDGAQFRQPLPCEPSGVLAQHGGIGRWIELTQATGHLSTVVGTAMSPILAQWPYSVRLAGPARERDVAHRATHVEHGRAFVGRLRTAAGERLRWEGAVRVSQRCRHLGRASDI